jgi:cytoskeletal protein CcmA (bactofilin family)
MRTSVLPAGVTLEGELRGSGDLVVRGTMVGSVDLDGMLTIDAGAVLRGEVRARAMVVRGEVEGPVTVLELLRLEAGAKVLGDVQADRVSAASGSVLRGRVRMTGADRLRRTVGGTLTAPFTSSGTLEAPGEVRAPIPAERLSSLTAAHGIRERATEPPEVRDRRPLREGTTDTPMRRMPRQAVPALSAPIPASAASPNMSAASPKMVAPGPIGPPAPVIPRLGRVRSQRREDPT